MHENIITLIPIKAIMQDIPTMVSAISMLPISVTKHFKTPIIPWLLQRNPRTPFNCVKIIITEVADVKPEMTGFEMKSTKKPRKNNLLIYETFLYFCLPNLKTPIKNSTQPHKKQSKIT